jgi:DNA-directed RNA polymerase subunit F
MIVSGRNEIFFIHLQKNNVMTTLNAIYDEIKTIPTNRLDELHQLIHSLIPDVKQRGKTPNARQKEILSYAGAFSSMTDEEYRDFTGELHKVRKTLFNRIVEL